MSGRDSIICSVGCGCSIEAADLLAALPETQRDLRTASVTAIYGLERVKYTIHQELGHFCWLYTALDKESIMIINNGPLELDMFMDRYEMKAKTLFIFCF
ncbi:unnamed protein product [Auanema sp. JU1783]|nr:unnamed protein product [Auanema sp. JU1783]